MFSQEGDTVNLSKKETKSCLPMDEECLRPMDNLVKLNDLNEPAILHNLRCRFKGDKIYTYVGTILCAVNPFKMLPLYTPAVIDGYKQSGARNNPPHVYALADNAYNRMTADGVNQPVDLTTFISRISISAAMARSSFLRCWLCGVSTAGA